MTDGGADDDGNVGGRVGAEFGMVGNAPLNILS